jgi:hypothetical protein
MSPNISPNSVKMVVTLANANELLRAPVIVLTESEVCNAAFMKGRKSAQVRARNSMPNLNIRLISNLTSCNELAILRNRQARYIVVMTLMECLRQEGEGHSRKGNISTLICKVRIFKIIPRSVPASTKGALHQCLIGRQIHASTVLHFS